MKKCIRLIALLMACVLCLAACGQSGSSSAAPASSADAPAGSAPETGDRPLKIGVTLVNLNIPHWVNMEWEYQQMAKETGHELTFVHAEGYENVEKQINQIQDFIAAGMDAHHRCRHRRRGRGESHRRSRRGRHSRDRGQQPVQQRQILHQDQIRRLRDGRPCRPN